MELIISLATVYLFWKIADKATNPKKNERHESVISARKESVSKIKRGNQ